METKMAHWLIEATRRNTCEDAFEAGSQERTNGNPARHLGE